MLFDMLVTANTNLKLNDSLNLSMLVFLDFYTRPEVVCVTVRHCGSNYTVAWQDLNTCINCMQVKAEAQTCHTLPGHKQSPLKKPAAA